MNKIIPFLLFGCSTLTACNTLLKTNNIEGGWVMDGYCGYESAALWFNDGVVEYTHVSDTLPPERRPNREKGKYTLHDTILELHFPNHRTYENVIYSYEYLTFYILSINGNLYLSKASIDELLSEDKYLSMSSSMKRMYKYQPNFDKSKPLELACYEYWERIRSGQE